MKRFLIGLLGLLLLCPQSSIATDYVTKTATALGNFEFSIDVDLGSSDTVISSQNAIKSYIDNHAAPMNGYYITTRDVPALTNATNLGLLSTGLLKMTVAGGIATVSTAVDGVDYLSSPATCTNCALTSNHYLITQDDATLTNAKNLGTLSSGLLKITVSGGIAVPSIAVDGIDYFSGGTTAKTIYPEFYGAIGDGVTNDYAAMQAAINAAAGVATVELSPYKTYKLNVGAGATRLSLPSNTTINGNGASLYGLLRVDGTNVSVNNLSVYVTNTDFPAYAGETVMDLYTNATSDISLKKVKFYLTATWVGSGTSTAILRNVGTNDISNLTVDECYFTSPNARNTGIKLWGGNYTNIRIKNNLLENIGSMGVEQTAVTSKIFDGLWITNNIIKNTGLVALSLNGMGLSLADSGIFRNIHVTGNTLDNCYGYALEIAAGAAMTEFSGIIVTENQFINNVQNHTIATSSSAANISGVQIDNNYFRDNSGNIRLNNLNDSSFSNNIVNIGGNAINISTTGYNNRFLSNTIIEPNGTPFLMAGSVANLIKGNVVTQATPALAEFCRLANSATRNIVTENYVTGLNTLNICGRDATLPPLNDFTDANTNITINNFINGNVSNVQVGAVFSSLGFVPDINDGAYLGTTALQFSDLFLAEGGVINWDNGDATLTQVGDVLTLAGADLKVTTPGNAATSVVTTDGTQTLSNKTLIAPILGAATATSINSVVTGWTQTTGTFTATPASTSTITMTTDLTATILVGYPLKYVIGGTTYYGVVTAIAANLLTVAGAPLGADVTALYYGDPNRVRQVTYDNSASTSVITTGTIYTLRWSLPKAYLVLCKYYQTVHDTHATHGKLTVKINATETNTSAGGIDIAADATWYGTVVDIATAAYDVNTGEDVTIYATQGGNVNGYGARVNMVFIIP